MAKKKVEILQLEHSPRYQHGAVSLKLVRSDGVTIDTGELENFVTPIGRQLDNNMGPGRLLSMGAELWGQTVVIQGMSLIGNHTKDARNAIYCDSSKELTLVLLNLGDDVNNIDEETSSVYLNSDDGSIKTAKVVGYANGNIQPTSDGKEGVIDFTKSEFIVNKFRQVNRWVFDTDVAVGTIDAVAMMPANWAKYSSGFGISAWRCLDKVNMQDPNTVSRAAEFCPPGIPGVTGNNSVLSDYNIGGKNRHKIDLLTGDVTDLDESEPWFTFPVGTLDWIIDGDYIYLLSVSGKSACSVDVYNKNTLALIDKFSVSVRSNSTGTGGGYVKASFLMKDNVLYITIGNNAGYTKYVALTKGAKAYWSAKTGGNYTSYSGFLTVPGFATEKVSFTNYGNEYLMFVGSNLAFTFSDLTDIAGSIDHNKTFHTYSNKSIKYKTDTRGGFLRIGVGAGFESVSNWDTKTNNKYIINNSGTLVIDNSESGLWISDESEHGNCYSIRVLSEPITKGASDKLYVSYGYSR